MQPQQQEVSAFNVTLQALNWLVVQQQWPLVEKLVNRAKVLKAKFKPQQKAQFSVYSAQLAIENGQLDTALKRLNEAVTIDPNLETADVDLSNNSWPKEVKDKFDEFKNKVKE